MNEKINEYFFYDKDRLFAIFNILHQSRKIFRHIVFCQSELYENTLSMLRN